MKNSVIKVIYSSSKKSICVNVDGKEKVLISDDKKQICASEFYDILKYEKNKIYELSELEKYDDISDDYNNYLMEIYDIFKTILKGIKK